MTDLLHGFPKPKNCPQAGECIRIERPEDGLAVVVLDPPHRSLAVLDAPLISDLHAVVDELENDRSLKAVVFCGRTPYEFAAGADVEGISGVTDKATAHEIIHFVHNIFRRIESLPATTVAAVGGAVPGGAYELSLACDFIIALNDDKTRIGLPETQLGIIPGWGGCHRLPRRVGITVALDAILSGRLFKAKAALKKGMVDRLAYADDLLPIAIEVAMGRMQVRKKKRGIKSILVDRNPLARMIIGHQVRKMIMAKTKGRYPAHPRAISLVLNSLGASSDKAAKREAAAIADLATGEVCKSLIGIFFASEAAKKFARGNNSFKPAKLNHAAEVGAGVMGGAIASLLAEKGLQTRLVDLSQDALDAAVIDHQQHILKKKSRRRLKPHLADAAIDRLSTGTDMVGLDSSQIVIEAVAEVIEIKRSVLADVAKKVDDDCIIATNTSSLSVSSIAEHISHPERVVGMHFFNPVRKMPLVEIIRGEQTSEETVIATAALATRVGKTPVIVKDVAGFLVNRLLGPYLDEAVRLFVDGAPASKIDSLMLKFGMPMGPLRLLDEVGFDIAMHASQSLEDAYGIRMRACTGIDSMAGDDRLGVKTKRGFYDYRGKGKEVLCDDLNKYQAANPAIRLSDEQIIDRLILSMANEAARCLAEEVVASEQELNLATVFGMGFAPFEGGLMRWVNSQGKASIAARVSAIAACEDIAQREGGTEKFTPSEWFMG
ncbi:MAG: 3-hydroxyacyl-CoA dehydrogenase NAD-binding domain-containing protein [Planctomycetota bacterium]|nr:3-hydroxyacyl-CoA dehydrogenase NAD-binding domain-containing protein [Planctomycetota bacterium]